MSRQSSVILDTPLTIPNLMSSARLVMAVAAAVLFASSSLEELAVGLCLTGVMLDAFDGWYARRFAKCSQLGRFLDPLADKILMAVVYGVIAIQMHSVVIWALFVLVTGRDLVVTASRSLTLRKNGSTYASDRFGKAKMIVQSVAGVGLLTYAYILRDGFTFSPYPVVIILAIITLLSYVSAGRYLFFRAMATSKRGL